MKNAFRDAGNVKGYPELTVPQTQALKFWRNTVGRCWKNKLLELWRTQNVVTGYHIDLRQLRNTHGPVWLSKMQLKVTA